MDGIFIKGTWEIVTATGTVVGRVQAIDGTRAVKCAARKFRVAAADLVANPILPTVYVRDESNGLPIDAE